MCSAVWKSRDDFLGDNSLVIKGYQSNLEYLQYGLFYFTHEVDGCFSTMALKVNEFYDLNPQNKFTLRKTLTDECPRYCHDKNNLQMCFAECECAYVRDFLCTLQQMKADSTSSYRNISKKGYNKTSLTNHF